MAGATLLAIVSFLFLGVIIQLLGGRGGGGSQIETYAECRQYGRITSYELHRLNDNQEILRRFLIVLYQQLADPADQEKMRALYPLQMFINQVAQNQNPERLINTWLITQYAQEGGISPDWNDILNLLSDLTGGYISDAVYDDTLGAIGASHQTIEYLLARHLRWQQALEQLNVSVSVVSPATRWDWYQRLNRQVTIEAAAVPVDSFVDQVGEPSAGQLNAFFEQHKGKRYNPTLPDSGFIMPMELAFQYVVAEPNQQLLDSITDEEMLVYYEANKETLFRKPTRPITDYPQLPGMMPGMPGGMMPFPTPNRPVMPVIPVPVEEMIPTDEPANESTPVTEESAPETSALPRVLTRFVSYQTDEANQASEATETITDEAPSTMVTPRIIIQEEEEEFVLPLSEESEVIDLSILYRPFDDVKDQIRETLAMEKASAGLPIIQATMKEYTAIYHEHFEQGKPIPPMPDLTGIAAEQGLELKTVPLGDIFTVVQTEMVRGLDRGLIVQLFSRTPLPFEGETFLGSNGPVLYWITEQKSEMKPKNVGEVKEIALKRWKEVEARTLAQKRAEELANEAKISGKPLAEVFAGRSEVPVVETEPFTWKTYRGVNPFVAVMQRVPPVLGEVREKGVTVGDAEINKVIVAPGSDFMEAVYALSVGETGVVFNQPQSVVYIVRVTSSSPSENVLWEQFQRAHYMEYFYAGQPEMFAAALDAWLTEIQKKTGFRWINKPESYESERYYEGREF